MLSVIQKEGGISSRGVNFVVVGKLGHGEPVCPVVLSLIDEYSEILLYLLIHPFCLTVRDGVISRGRVSFDSQQCTEIFHESRYKLLASITNKLLGEPVMLKDIVLV